MFDYSKKVIPFKVVISAFAIFLNNINAVLQFAANIARMILLAPPVDDLATQEARIITIIIFGGPLFKIISDWVIFGKNTWSRMARVIKYISWIILVRTRLKKIASSWLTLSELRFAEIDRDHHLLCVLLVWAQRVANQDELERYRLGISGQHGNAHFLFWEFEFLPIFALIPSVPESNRCINFTTQVVT